MQKHKYYKSIINQARYQKLLRHETQLF
ncbi:unnamed protein product, partial [Vitis vinifera]